MLGWRTSSDKKKGERKNEKAKQMKRAADPKTLYIHMLIPYTHNSADCRLHIHIYISNLAYELRRLRLLLLGPAAALFNQVIFAF